jgi:hypothetical protein
MRKCNSIKILALIILFKLSMLFGQINYYHVDAAAGTGDRTEGTGWADAVNLDTLAVMTLTAPAVIYIRGDGTPNGDVDISSQDGTATDPILVTGVLENTTDEGSSVPYSSFAKINDTATMPLLDFSIYNFQFGDYYHIRGLSVISEKTGVVYPGVSSELFECWIRNDYVGTAGRQCVSTLNYTYIHNCIFSAPAAHGISTFADCIIQKCTFIDFTDDLSQGRYAITCAANKPIIIGNKFKNCKAGINIGTQDYARVFDNTFYSGGTFIVSTNAYSVCVANNVVYDQSAKFAIWTTQTDMNSFYNNHTTSIDDFTLVDTNSYCRDFELTTGDPLIDSITLAVDDSTSVIYRDSESSAP